NSVRACAIVTIANAARKAAKVADACELAGFEDKIIVSEALKFSETHIWSAAVTLECGGLTPLMNLFRYYRSLRRNASRNPRRKAASSRRTPIYGGDSPKALRNR